LGAACAVNPVSGEQELVLMSEAQELNLGARYYPETTQTSGGVVPQDTGLETYVNQVGQRLAAASHRSRLPWEFNVVNTNEINAFALPGGKVSITRGLITKMQNEDELAAVLGHEIGHITARHSVAQYTRGVLITAMVAGVGLALTGSDYENVGKMVAGAAGTLLLLSYSRDQERQADELGHEYMVRNNYNPKAMPRVFQMFQSLRKSEPGLIESLLSSHPLDSERIAAAEKRVEMTSPRLTNQAYKVDAFKNAMAKQTARKPAYELAGKGDGFMAKKDYARAAQKYRQAIEIFPGEPIFHTRLGVALTNQKKMSEAAPEIARGAKLGKDVFLPNHAAGLFSWRQNNLRQALTYFERADRLLPSHVVNKFFVGACNERLGNKRQAIGIYRQLVAISPKSDVGKAAQARLTALGVR
jgi:predicted Zn-dependent protease